MKHSKIFKSSAKHTGSSAFTIQKKRSPFFSKGTTKPADKPFFRPVVIQEKQENNTGLPNQLKSGVESLSGTSLNDVKVHFNSPKPIQLQALAYTQGNNIYLGPGQEKHLPHEAWHVAQQKQGKVQPTTYEAGFAVNNAASLEKEADIMGEKASRGPNQYDNQNHAYFSKTTNAVQRSTGVIQMKNFKAKYPDSSFQSSAKKNAYIYLIYHKATDLSEYVGKTIRTVDKRYSEHQRSKGLSSAYDVEEMDSGSWTPFELATHEQFYMGEAGGKANLLNKIYALTPEKWEWFKTPSGHPHNSDQADNLTLGHFY